MSKGFACVGLLCWMVVGCAKKEITPETKSEVTSSVTQEPPPPVLSEPLPPVPSKSAPNVTSYVAPSASSEPPPGVKYEIPSVCGNHIVEAGEACDDGNVITETQEGCVGYGQVCTSCQSDCSTLLTFKGPYCGDGMVQAANHEQCDDGNTVTETTSSCAAYDKECVTCKADCSGELTLKGPSCGDGVVQSSNEACDDGNTVTETDAVCSVYGQTCKTCKSDCSAELILKGPRCGDGMIQSDNHEQCDDANEVNIDACLNTCVLAQCGDGALREGFEICEDGNTVNETACPYGTKTCTSCNASCTATLNLVGPYCGDGVVQASDHEICDDKNNVTETDADCSGYNQVCTTCKSDCLAAFTIKGPRCGDGIVQREHEQCDDGNTNNNDACLNTCVPTLVISAGGYHTCALWRGDHKAAKCWGWGMHGQLGYGTTENVGDGVKGMATVAGIPFIDFGANNFPTAIAAGKSHTCALLNQGRVKCWGLGDAGQLGQGNTSNIGDGVEGHQSIAETPPINLGEGLTAVAITAGDQHSCALLNNGTIKCWGYGAFGQLGQGYTLNIGDDVGLPVADNVPIVLATDRSLTAVAVEAGANHTCGLLSNGSLKCWGQGLHGKLGNNSTANIGDTLQHLVATSLPIKLGIKVRTIAAGADHTCGLMRDGKIKCWGLGANGRLGKWDTKNIGDGIKGHKTATESFPILLGKDLTAVAVVAGYSHTCALLNNGTVKCWGAGSQGQLGVGNNENLTAPGNVPVDFGTGLLATSIVSGMYHTCALLSDGKIKCWGMGAFGQLGNNSTANVGDDPKDVMTAVVLERLHN